MHDSLLLIAFALAALFAVAFLVMALRAPRRDPAVETIFAGVQALAGQQQALEGRLAQMAEAEAAAQSRLHERMQAQEREISRALEERLSRLATNVGETLEKSKTETTASIHDLKTRLAIIDQAQKNITDLSTQVVGLQDILSNKQARGAFGEVQLNDLVTKVLPPNAYTFQASVGGGRVDCLLTLPNPPGPIAIDSKFPLESYRALCEAGDDAVRAAARRRFASDLKTHIDAIASKYIVPGETAESALMFLPSEAVYAELHANFQAVVEEGYRRRVWIVSPTTLWATLTTIRAVLKDVRMREQAGVIQAEVRTLLTDVVRLDDRVGKLQRHFDQANEDIRQIRISTDKVTKRGERIDELQLEDTETDLAAVATAPARASVGAD